MNKSQSHVVISRKFLLNFLDICKKIIKKEPSDFYKRKKYEKSHKLAEKSVSKKKKEVKGKWNDPHTPCTKGIVTGSSRKRSFVKKEKFGKNRRRSKCESLTLFSDKKLKEKFDKSWASKKVVYGKYIDHL